MTPQLNASIDMTNATDTPLVVEHVQSHGSIMQPYYRLRFGDHLTVYLSDGQCEELFYLMNNRERV